MCSLINITAGLLVVALSSRTSFGQVDSDASSTPQARQRDAVEPEVGMIWQARSYLDLEVRGEQGQAIGKVDDLLLDLDASRVALAAVRLGHDQQANTILVPFRVLVAIGNMDAATLQATNQMLAEAPPWREDQPLERAAVARVYATFRADPYWKAADEAQQEKLGKLHSLKKLIDMPIHNNKGTQLGTITDFAIARDKGLIAYAALSCSCFEAASDLLFPVPLSALVVEKDSRSWLLELPLDVLENTPTFRKSAWPETIDRGWVEYVHVRYGRSPFGGVRTEKSAEATAEAK